MRCIPLLAFALVAQAAVVRVDVAEKKDIAYPGYERVTGKAYFAVDPKVAANKNIVDLSLAPKNAKGQVEFSADLYMLRPKDKSTGNGTALFQVSNRGGRDLLNFFDLANGGQLAKPEDFGDPMLFRMGFTMVWVGWEWDVQGDDQLKLYAPKVPGLAGKVMAQIIVNAPSTSQSLGDRALQAYSASDGAATLTVRDSMDGQRTNIARDQFRFSADGLKIEYGAGFIPGKIYELVYESKDATVVGLGPAAVRDYISYMKSRNEVRRAIAFGNSQSGRFLRTYLYDGFNADEQGRKVFEGVWANVSGAGRGDFNYRFAQPSRSDGNYPIVMFPFTDDNQTDGSRTDGLLAKAKKDNVVPKIFYTNSSIEYWGRDAALIHMSSDGKKDVDASANTRIYYMTGAPHGPNGQVVRNNTQNLANPLDYRLAMRGLLPALTEWVTEGKEPPASKVPRIDQDSLVPLSALAFPKIPGVRVPQEPNTPFRFDFGADYLTKGIASSWPPSRTEPYAVRLPQTDADGNEIAGIRLPDQKVPLATYTGWNLRDAKIGGENMRLPLIGSLIPFARTKAEREKSGDPRLSVEERYSSEQDYLRRVEAAARALAGDRYMLEQDIPLAVEKAKTRWTFVQRGTN